MGRTEQFPQHPFEVSYKNALYKSTAIKSTVINIVGTKEFWKLQQKFKFDLGLTMDTIKNPSYFNGSEGHHFAQAALYCTLWIASVVHPSSDHGQPSLAIFFEFLRTTKEGNMAGDVHCIVICKTKIQV